MKKMNERGSTIVTGIVIVLIIFIILGTALAIATSYQKRAINEHARKQAYLNDISVIETIAGQINNSEELFLPSNNYTDRKITDVQLPNGHAGEISAVIKYDNNDKNIIYIQVTSIYNHQTEEIQLTLMKQSGQWKKVTYSKIGDEYNHENE